MVKQSRALWYVPSSCLEAAESRLRGTAITGATTKKRATSTKIRERHNNPHCFHALLLVLAVCNFSPSVRISPSYRGTISQKVSLSRTTDSVFSHQLRSFVVVQERRRSLRLLRSRRPLSRRLAENLVHLVGLVPVGRRVLVHAVFHSENTPKGANGSRVVRCRTDRVHARAVEMQHVHNDPEPNNNLTLDCNYNVVR